MTAFSKINGLEFPSGANPWRLVTWGEFADRDVVTLFESGGGTMDVVEPDIEGVTAAIDFVSTGSSDAYELWRLSLPWSVSADGEAQVIFSFVDPDDLLVKTRQTLALGLGDPAATTVARTGSIFYGPSGGNETRPFSETVNMTTLAGASFTFPWAPSVNGGAMGLHSWLRAGDASVPSRVDSVCISGVTADSPCAARAYYGANPTQVAKTGSTATPTGVPVYAGVVRPAGVGGLVQLGRVYLSIWAVDWAAVGLPIYGE